MTDAKALRMSLKSRVSQLMNIQKEEIMDVDIVEISPQAFAVSNGRKDVETVGTNNNKVASSSKGGGGGSRNSNDQYNQIQSIFTNYPGLFSFTSITSNKNVWCKSCKRETPLIGLQNHVQDGAHAEYFKVNSALPSVVPDYQIIVDRFPGIFSLMPNKQTLWCNACNKETTRINLTRHLTSGSHGKNVNKAMKKEVNYDELAVALSDRVFSSITNDPHLMYCNICEKKLNNGLTELKAHIESPEHTDHNRNAEFAGRGLTAVLTDFASDGITQAQGDGLSGKLWCNPCKVIIHNTLYKSVERHIGTSGHVRSAAKLNPEEVSQSEFEHDLARFFRENKIPLKRLPAMKPFFVKYMRGAHTIPDEPAVRKTMFSINEFKSSEETNESTEEAKKPKVEINKKQRSVPNNQNFKTVQQLNPSSVNNGNNNNSRKRCRKQSAKS